MSLLRVMAAAARRPFVLLLLSLGALSTAWSQDLPEYRLKAAFLYNFAAFTDWPADGGNNLQVCVYGADPFGEELDAINGKSIGARTLVVQRKTSAESLRTCQILFVPPASIAQLPRLLEAIRGLPVLTVADTPGAMQKGVMLNMLLQQGRISFEANLGAARAARLALSSKLLRLATEVLQ